jgi:CBS domain containing-hemolysin-like protein
LLEEGAKSGMLGAEPAEMIRNVLEFKDLTARDVMIPRSQVEAIDISTPFDDVLRIVAEGGHSRYPVIRSRLDDVIGLLYAKDLFKASEVDGEKRLTDLVRGPANFVAESRKLSSLLKEMRGRRQHLAIVVDELGAVSGIVTLEDVLEEIVGDIRDEHDEKPIEELGDGHIMVDGAVSLNDLGAYLGTSIVTDGDYDSLNALLTHHLGGIPEIGTTLEKYGLKFVVRDKDERRIGKIEVCSL